MTMDLQVNGAGQLEKLFKEFPVRIRRDVINAVAARGATILKKHMKKNLEANGSVDSGKLLNSIKSRKKRGVHGVQEIFTDRSAPHSHLVEFGTGPRKLKKPHPEEFMPGEWKMVTHAGSAPAKPFMRPAMDENKDELMAEMSKRMVKRMDKEAEKMTQKYGTLKKSYRRKLAK